MLRRPEAGVPRSGLAAVAVVIGLLVVGCAGPAELGRTAAPPSSATADGGGGSPSAEESEPADAPTTAPSPTAAASTAAAPRLRSRLSAAARDVHAGRPRPAMLSIPKLGLHDLAVVPYRGEPDDAPGTEIQNGGVLASPHGPRGGVGPGGIGNYIVTGHRTSHGAPFADVPSLRNGDRVVVETEEVVYEYVVRRTLRVSFRSEESKALQTAEVPGFPERSARRAWITLSTCATPEDHARGNYWSDEFGNPEHRIDKIGVLVSSRPASDGD